MNKKLEKSLNKIDKLFDKMLYNDVRTNAKRRTSISTNKNYRDQVKAILREANKKFGVEKIEDLDVEMFEEMIKKRIDNYRDGATSEAHNINSKIAAMRAFSIGFKETNIYRKTKNRSAVSEIDEDYLEDVRDFVKTSNVYRRGSDSTVLRASKEQVDVVVENLRSGGYNTSNRFKAADIALLSLSSGARISSCLKMRAKDIDFDNKVITMEKAKGGLTYYVDMSDEDILLLKALVKDLKPGQRVFEFIKKDGKIMSVDEARRVVDRYVKIAARDFNEESNRKIINSNGQETIVKHRSEFAFHSIRKAFALKIMQRYIDKINNQKDIEDEVKRLAKRDPKVLDKYERLVKRFNQYRIKNSLPMKEISKKEAVTFFTSIQLGHYRNDIVSSYYCTFEEAIKNKR